MLAESGVSLNRELTKCQSPTSATPEWVWYVADRLPITVGTPVVRVPTAVKAGHFCAGLVAVESGHVAYSALRTVALPSNVSSRDGAAEPSSSTPNDATSGVGKLTHAVLPRIVTNPCPTWCDNLE